MTNAEKKMQPLLKPVTIEGRTYQSRYALQRKYNMTKEDIYRNIKNGLPHKTINGNVFINEDDFHRYFSGEIGEGSEAAPVNTHK